MSGGEMRGAMATRREAVRWSLAAAAALLSAGAGAAQAQSGADLNISPKRVVFSPDMRSATVYVFNRGGEPATYNISLTDRVMTPDGQVRAVTDPDVTSGAADVVARFQSAQPLLTFTPRRVTLLPGQSQVVRIRALRPADSATPEYHTHLTVTTVPPESAGVTAEEAANAAPGAVVARMNTLFSISIAVIVRQGPVAVQAGLDRASYALRAAAEPNGAPTPVISVDMLRKGPNSIYGDVEVRDAKAAKSSPPLGAVRGVAVYAEVDRRSVAIPLSKTPAAGQVLEITLKDDDAKPGAALATTAITVP